MTKLEFLSALRGRLANLSAEDLERSIEYYSESIDDRMEDGLTEEEAVEAMGSVDEIVSQLLIGASPPKLVKEKAKGKSRSWGPGVIALLILGFPLWFPLLAAFASIVFTLYVVFWSLIVAFYAVDVAFAAGAVAGIFGFGAGLLTGGVAHGLFTLGGGLICVGLTILWFFACHMIAKWMVWLSKTVLLGIKSCFVRKENA